MKTVIKRGLCILLSFLVVIAILPQITIKAKAASGVDDFVTRCYQVAFQRTPDQGGFDFWKAKITDGKLVGSTVVYEFIFSKEYEGQNRTDKEFVNDLYTMFMGRAADQEGYNYWCGQMKAGMTRKEVFAGFANSKEFYELCVSYGITSGFYTNDYDLGQVNNVNLFVERLYKTCLGRLGDQGGQKYWVEGMLKGELTGIACAANYIKSSEYEALGLTDEQYVENLYIGFMGRTYDEGGKANWLGNLTNNTKTRDQVFEGFANSPEFQGICAGYGIECGSYTATDIANPNKNETNKKILKTKISNNSEYRSSVSDYDEKGNKTKDTYYNSGDLTGYDIYEYDEKGNNVKTSIYYGWGELSFYNEYAYENGNQIWWGGYYSDGSLAYAQFRDYDASGNLYRIYGLDSNQNVEYYYQYEYDNNGNTLKECQYYPDGTIYGICVYYEYDSNGNQIKTSIYDKKEKLESYYLSEFDKNGNKVKESCYDKYGKLQYYKTFEYDKKGNIVKDSWYKSWGELSYYSIYEYDEDGNEIKFEQYNSDGTCDFAESYEYIYCSIVK